MSTEKRAERAGSAYERKLEELAAVRAETPTVALTPKCPRCGTSLREGAGFCHACGAKAL